MRHDTDCLKALLAAGQPGEAGLGARNCLDRTAAELAVIEDQVEHVRLLLDAGYDVNARSATMGSTLLHMCVYSGGYGDGSSVKTTEIMPMILAKKGVDVNIFDHRDYFETRTVLHVALEKRNFRAVSQLLAAGADVQAGVGGVNKRPLGMLAKIASQEFDHHRFSARRIIREQSARECEKLKALENGSHALVKAELAKQKAAVLDAGHALSYECGHERLACLHEAQSALRTAKGTVENAPPPAAPPSPPRRGAKPRRRAKPRRAETARELARRSRIDAAVVEAADYAKHCRARGQLLDGSRLAKQPVKMGPPPAPMEVARPDYDKPVFFSMDEMSLLTEVVEGEPVEGDPRGAAMLLALVARDAAACAWAGLAQAAAAYSHAQAATPAKSPVIIEAIRAQRVLVRRMQKEVGKLPQEQEAA